MTTQNNPLASLVNQTQAAANKAPANVNKGKAPSKAKGSNKAPANKVDTADNKPETQAQAQGDAAPANGNASNGANDGTSEKTVHVLQYTDAQGKAQTASYTRFSVAMRDLRAHLDAGLSVKVDRTKARVKQTVELAE